MKRNARLLFLCVSAGLAVVMYVASYIGIRIVKPNCINTPDGPIAAFRLIYYPLRHMDGQKPDWYSAAAAEGYWLDAKIDWINRGNGYLYFTWEGREDRAGCDGSRGFHENDLVRLHFKFELVTWDDFTTRLVPTIDNIAPSNEHMHWTRE